MTARRRRDAAGAAVVDFVLVLLVLIPLFLGIVQLGLVLHVRNTLTSAASEGARYGAAYDRTAADGAARTAAVIEGVLAHRFAEQVSAGRTTVDGYPGVVVTVRAEVPPLGLWGPGIELSVQGHAVQEAPP